MYTPENIEDITNAIFDLYKDPVLKNFKPPTAKNINNKKNNVNCSDKTKNLMELTELCKYYIQDEYSLISGYPSLSDILKNTLRANIETKTILTENGKTRNELLEGIRITEMYINDLNSKNVDKEIINNIVNNLQVLKNKYTISMELGDFERKINYKEIAKNTLKLLNNASNDYNKRIENNIYDKTNNEQIAEQIHIKICEKLNVTRSNPNNKNDKLLYNKYYTNNYTNNYTSNYENGSNYTREYKKTNDYVPPHIKQKNEKIKYDKDFPTLM